MTMKTFSEIFPNDDENSWRETFSTDETKKSWILSRRKQYENVLLTFTDKESYLKWKETWKAELNKINEEIRLSRKNRKMYIWSGKPSRTEKKTIIGKNPSYDSYAQITRQNLREKARYLLIIRFLAKEKARKQWENLPKAA